MSRLLTLASVIMATHAMDSYSIPKPISKPLVRHENMTITFHHQNKCKIDAMHDKHYSIMEGTCHRIPGEDHLWYIVSIEYI